MPVWSGVECSTVASSFLLNNPHTHTESLCHPLWWSKVWSWTILILWVCYPETEPAAIANVNNQIGLSSIDTVPLARKKKQRKHCYQYAYLFIINTIGTVAVWCRILDLTSKWFGKSRGFPNVLPTANINISICDNITNETMNGAAAKLW